MLRRHKRLIGALVVAPYAWFAMQLLAMPVVTMTAAEAAFDGWMLSLALGVLLLLVAAALWVAFLVDACRSPAVAEGERMLWILVLVLANVAATPFYWYLQIWRTAPGAGRDAPGLGLGG
jgi:hypothetical protein